MHDKIKHKYSSQAVANFFISKANEEGINDLSPMKLQKLVYIALGWSLALTDTDIIGGEEVEAWQHGPVIPSLYFTLKQFGSGHIDHKIPGVFCQYDDDGNEIGPPQPPEISESDEEITAILDAVWKNYKNKSGAQLREITHRHKTPWKLHYVEGKRNIEIPKETIRAFYEALKAKAETSNV